MHGHHGFVRIGAGCGVVIDDADDAAGLQRGEQRREQRARGRSAPSRRCRRANTYRGRPSTSARRRRWRPADADRCAARTVARRSAGDRRRSALRSSRPRAPRAHRDGCERSRGPSGPTTRARISVYQPVAAFMSSTDMPGATPKNASTSAGLLVASRARSSAGRSGRRRQAREARRSDHAVGPPAELLAVGQRDGMYCPPFSSLRSG